MSRNVPPQKRHWWLKRIKEFENGISDLPTELVDIIGEEVRDFPIGLEEAKELREELMKKRGLNDRMVEYQVTQENHFSFCEY
jgi:hypothetical protein